MTLELQQLESAIQALDAQRALLGDAVTETALAPLRARRDALLASAAASVAAAASAADPATSADLAATADPADSSAAPAPEQLLKQVTVLFLDAVGSTALSQHLDPEDVHHITGEEMRVRHLCVKVLRATDNARAAPQLEALHADLQATAARIADAATRLAFLENVAAHREIVAAWTVQAAPG